MNARDEILARVRKAVGDKPTIVPPDRSYRGPGDLIVSNPVALMTSRLTEYGAGVRRCSPDDVTATIGRLLAEGGIGSVVVPPGLPHQWLDVSRARLVEDEPPLSATDLDRVDGVVTTCALGVALTGTIVLDGGTGQGRRALSLIPDYHLIVLHARQIVAGVPDAVAALDSSRTLTWISGPSATSDIELERVEGVHGPRALDVVIVG